MTKLIVDEKKPGGLNSSPANKKVDVLTRYINSIIPQKYDSLEEFEKQCDGVVVRNFPCALYSVKDYAEDHGMYPCEVSNGIKSGVIPAYKIGRNHKIASQQLFDLKDEVVSVSMACDYFCVGSETIKNMINSGAISHCVFRRITYVRLSEIALLAKPTTDLNIMRVVKMVKIK